MMQSVKTFLAIGFVPSTEMATEYLDALLSRRETSSDAPDLLRHLIQELAYNQGHKDIVIPLSGGLDSRSILGAALDVYDSSNIHCITCGSENLRDCVVATRTSKRLNITCERIDVNELTWDIDDMEALARERFRRYRDLMVPDQFMAFKVLAARVPNERAILSGFLGDSISGDHLPTRKPLGDPEETITRFIHKNLNTSLWRPSAEVRQTFLEFLSANAHMLRGLPGATLFDLLDLGFRQLRRIKAMATGAFPTCITPFEDPRWVSHWFSRPYHDRVGRRAYTAEMQRAFPAVFVDPPPRTSLRQRIHRTAAAVLPVRGRAALRRLAGMLSGGPVQRFEMTGDPRRNRSMATAMETLITSFDSRRLIETPILPHFRTLLTNPTGGDAEICRWVVAAELHIRVGNFAELEARDRV